MSRLHRSLLRVLVADIVSSRLTDGERLPREADLARRFDVSRGVARECIRGLEERGLVAVKHGRGATVLPDSSWDMFNPDVIAAMLESPRAADVLGEYLECRRLLEISAAGLAAERATSDQLVALSDALESMTAAAVQAPVSPSAEDRYHEADVAFHRAVIAAAGNRALGGMTEPVHRALAAARRPLARPDQRVARSLPEHRRILSAIAARDPDEARAAMRDHLLTVERYLREYTGGLGRGRAADVVTVAEAFFVARTMQALEVLSFQSASAPQIAEALKVHPRTARRLLNRLAADGWLQRIEGARPMYVPTMRIVALAAQLADRAPVVRLGAAVAADLHTTSGRVVHLAVPSYRSALRLLRVNGDVDSRPQLRDLAPAHAIAGGKLLLAYREPWRESVLERPLAVVTEATVIDPDAVRAEAAMTRARGFAVEDGEFRHGVRAVAAPVRDGFGDVVAALAVSGANAELDDIERVARQVAAAATELTEQLIASAP